MKKLIYKSLKKGKVKYVNSEDNNIVILSDLHLGTGYANDDEVKNNLFVFNALKYYLDNDYTVILNGDTFELCECKDIDRIKRAHSDIMWLLEQLFYKGKLVITKGNHDGELTPKKLLKRRDPYKKSEEYFLPNIELFDFVYIDTNYLICHGHQSSFKYYYFNKIMIPIIRLWGYAQRWFMKDPTGTYGTHLDNTKEYKEFSEFAVENNVIVICGHTHELEFGYKNYYNEGGCVLPRCITCGELVKGIYTTFKWAYEVEDGIVKLKKTRIA